MLAYASLNARRCQQVIRCFRGFGEHAHPDVYLENVRIPFAEPWLSCFPESASHVRDADASFALWDHDNARVAKLMHKDMCHPMALLVQKEENVPMTSLDALFEAAKDAGEFDGGDAANKRYTGYRALSAVDKDWLFQTFLAQACQFLASTATLANKTLRNDADDTRFVDGDFIKRSWQGAATFDGWKAFYANNF